MFILSTCSGYYGLELAMEKPFDTSFGLGHSPASLSVYEALTGDSSLHQRTYTYRNGADGWSEDYYWSTLIAWIANDVGFAGAVFVLALIAFMWGKWWREAAAGMSDPAAVLFALSTTMIFYFPANDQVLASYDPATNDPSSATRSSSPGSRSGSGIARAARCRQRCRSIKARVDAPDGNTRLFRLPHRLGVDPA